AGGARRARLAPPGTPSARSRPRAGAALPRRGTRRRPSAARQAVRRKCRQRYAALAADLEGGVRPFARIRDRLPVNPRGSAAPDQQPALEIAGAALVRAAHPLFRDRREAAGVSL